MSQFWDFTAGGGANIDTSVGPQTDGTNVYSPIASTIPTPADTAGGAPAQYGSAILDIFKTGVGAWSAANAQQQLFDYKKFEATNGGLYQQGKSAAMPAAASGGGQSGLMMMALIGIVVFAVLTHKG